MTQIIAIIFSLLNLIGGCFGFTVIDEGTYSDMKNRLTFYEQTLNIVKSGASYDGMEDDEIGLIQTAKIRDDNPIVVVNANAVANPVAKTTYDDMEEYTIGLLQVSNPVAKTTPPPTTTTIGPEHPTPTPPTQSTGYTDYYSKIGDALAKLYSSDINLGSVIFASSSGSHEWFIAGSESSNNIVHR